MMYYNALPGSGGYAPGNPKVEFGRRVSAAMRRLGINQSELARRMSLIAGREIGRDNVSGYVRGQSMPRPEYLDPLAKALGMTAEDLLPAGAVPSVERDDPLFDIKVMSPGRALLRVNLVVDMETALAVGNLINKSAVKERSEP